MEHHHKALLLQLLILFLGFSYVLSTRPVPTDQSALLKAGNQEDPSLQGFVDQGLAKEGKYGLELEEEGIIRGRMEIESNDYPGTGANNHHDPKTPGRS